MWYDYFFSIQNKYSMRVSKKEPLVIKLDGKNVTKNKNINLIDKFNGSFNDNLMKTVKYFTQNYKCYAIFGSDEVSFIIPNVISFIEQIGSDRANEIVALFSQSFFYYFNQINKNNLTFWHVKCFSIPKEKVMSYVKYHSRSIENVTVPYFLRKNGLESEVGSLAEKIQFSKKMSNYSVLEKVQKRNIIF